MSRIDEIKAAQRVLLQYGRSIFETGIVIPDASVLLRLYESAPDERNDILAAFGDYRSRIWIPHRTQTEVLRRRSIVRTKNRVATIHVAKVIPELLDKAVRGLEKRRDIVSAYNPAKLLEETLEHFQREIIAQFECSIRAEESASFAAVDAFLDAVLSEPNVGAPLSSDELERVLRTGQNRFDNNIPPGFEDRGKLRNRSLEDACGDLIFWEEILRFAATRQRGVFVVTAEEKADWWDRSSGAPEPHSSMIEEMRARAGQGFVLLRLSDFVSIRTNWEEALYLIDVERSITKFVNLTPGMGRLTLHGAYDRWVANFGKIDLLSDILAHQTDYDKWIANIGKSDLLSGILPQPTDYDKWIANIGKSDLLSGILAQQTHYDKWIANVGKSDLLSGILAHQTDYDKWIANIGKSNLLSDFLGRQAKYDPLNASKAAQRRNERARRRREQARASGLCTVCLKRPATTEEDRRFSTCSECRARRRK
jgi:hypothetical protein